ncbi:unnamed protein product [Cuscuta europaea]|uniref:DUF4218 domain-containing protein n=1 Tax=Cuscuta europaea TaxID=41803 RepID=A0A9P0YGY5_CUSEU|nr:unnamed protein product [Cuscuta europaea]
MKLRETRNPRLGEEFNMQNDFLWGGRKLGIFSTNYASVYFPHVPTDNSRFLGDLKKKATNKAHIEASIFQAYIQQETSTFSSFYFEREVISKRKRPAWNDDIGEDSYDKVVSIFNYPGRGKGAATYRYIVGGEMKIAHTYILMNCPEILPFYNEFRASLSAFPDDAIDAMVDSDFAL